LAKNLIKLLEKYNLKNKIILYVKNEGSNLNTMIVALKVVVSFEILGLEESYQGTYFVHAFLKAYQYVMGPTTLLGAAGAPLDHCFIFRIFLEFF
jgi:hypothetical protein